MSVKTLKRSAFPGTATRLEDPAHLRPVLIVARPAHPLRELDEVWVGQANIGSVWRNDAGEFEIELNRTGMSWGYCETKAAAVAMLLDEAGNPQLHPPRKRAWEKHAQPAHLHLAAGTLASGETAQVLSWGKRTLGAVWQAPGAGWTAEARVSGFLYAGRPTMRAAIVDLLTDQRLPLSLIPTELGPV